MTQAIQTKYEQIIHLLDKKELKTAFDTLQRLAVGFNAYQFQDELLELQETYKKLLHYYIAGSTDPMRQKIFAELRASLYEIMDRLMLSILTVDSPEMYYAIRRVTTITPVELAKGTSLLSLFASVGLQKAEQALPQVFKFVWTSSSLLDDWVDSLQQSIQLHELGLYINEDNGFVTVVNCQIVSALTLGLQAFFDKKKLHLLFLAADSIDEEVRIRAYIGILITLYKYQHRIDCYPDILHRLDTLSENEGFTKTVYLIILRFILSRDTEKITAKMREEIVPEMMKLQPKIKSQTSSKDNSPDLIEFDMNPEWMEKLENSPLGKKLEEFNQLQEEGADVMHFSFVHLKHFPFFDEISNWFIPFYKESSALSGYSALSNTLEIMTGAGLMCNSDLYSFYFSIKMMRDDGRLSMINTLESQLVDFKKQKNADLQTHVDKTERIIGQYIQDLYRFYKLCPRRKEFSDIFTQSFDFHNLPIIKRYFSDKNDLLSIAEYYLRKHYFEDALIIYNQLTNKLEEDEMVFQKKGYCRQMTGDYEGALSDYIKAELINPDSKWLLRRIAQCYRAAKQPKEALNYYLRLETLEPDNLSVLLNIGSCYLEMKKYADTLKYYYKVDYLDNDNGKAWRPIAWCSFLTGNYEQAQNYYRKILASNPSYQDYINAGHTEWTLHQLQSAFNYYQQSIQVANSNFESFLKEFENDIPTLLSAGILSEEIPYMLDKLRYR